MGGKQSTGCGGLQRVKAYRVPRHKMETTACSSPCAPATTSPSTAALSLPSPKRLRALHRGPFPSTVPERGRKVGFPMISVTVPICNEAESLPTLCERIRETLESVGRPWELILVNDGSTDGSDDVLDELAAAEPRFRVVHFRRNFGQTAAMMAGFDFARGDVIIPIDGDLQNDPADIPKMLAKLDEGYDVCSGWRKDRKDNSLKRNLPSIMANRLISFVSGVRLHDFGCSLKAYRREVVEGLRLYGEMHRFLPIYVSWHGARITEVEVTHYARTSGHSKYGLERVLKVLADLVVVKFLDRFQQKPMYLFGMVGLAAGFISFCAGALALWRKLIEGE